MFDDLRQHRAIGWDMDQTLIESKAARRLHQFIRQTPHIRHFIVTFRTHGMQHDVWSDLSQYHSAPPRAAFGGLFYPTDEMHNSFSQRKLERQVGLLTGDLTPEELLLLEWKGYACAQGGMTALVDDLTEHVELGCIKYNIQLFHPKDF